VYCKKGIVKSDKPSQVNNTQGVRRYRNKEDHYLTDKTNHKGKLEIKAQKK
jgi:hypothetical protein